MKPTMSEKSMETPKTPQDDSAMMTDLLDNQDAEMNTDCVMTDTKGTWKK